MNVTDIPFAELDFSTFDIDHGHAIGVPHFRPAFSRNEQRLSAPHLAGERVTIERVGSQSILRGTVKTYFQKQMAQEAVRLNTPDATIVNQIQVRGQGTLNAAGSTDHF